MRTPRDITKPQPGYWAVRLVKGGPEVAACIAWETTTHEPGAPTNLMVRSPVLTARINGAIVALDEVWLRRGREISKEEHDFLVRDRAWCRENAPHLPEAAPTKPVDLGELPPLF